MENETVLIDFNNLGEENEREKKIIIHKSKETNRGRWNENVSNL